MILRMINKTFEIKAFELQNFLKQENVIAILIKQNEFTVITKQSTRN